MRHAVMCSRPRTSWFALAALSVVAAASPAVAQEAAHPELPSLEQLLDDFDNGALTLDDLRRLGLSVFTTPFNTHDGFGDGPFDPGETDTRRPGQRATLQGNGKLLRVNGLDAQSCNECHTIVSHRTRPPTLGIGGVGGVVTNAFIMGSLLDLADSADDRMLLQPGHEPELPLEPDGVADFNGRFANPPFLFGGGGVELLAKEMTADLQRLLGEARQAAPGTVTRLLTHGTDFGSIRTVDAAGSVELQVEGIGPEDRSAAPPEEVLVVRPFGRKGEAFSMRDFDRAAMEFHFGIEPVEVVGEGIDRDGDGLVNEVTVAEMSMLHLFDVTNPPPFMERLDAEGTAGFETFIAIGCAACHHPEKVTDSRYLPLATPEVATRPFDNVYFEVDLTRFGFRSGPRVRRRDGERGVTVSLFSDLKRHEMGPGLAETFEYGDIPNDEFITARLWGVADTAPYLHDGRATTLVEAIELHGGEAQTARDAFVALGEAPRRGLFEFLGSLRTPVAPNAELLDR